MQIQDLVKYLEYLIKKYPNEKLLGVMIKKDKEEKRSEYEKK